MRISEDYAIKYIPNYVLSIMENTNIFMIILCVTDMYVS